MARPDLVRGLITDAPIVGPSWRPVHTFVVAADGPVGPAIVSVQHFPLLPPLYQLHRLLCSDEDALARTSLHFSARLSINGDIEHYKRARAYFATVESALASGVNFIGFDRTPIDGKLSIAA